MKRRGSLELEVEAAPWLQRRTILGCLGPLDKSQSFSRLCTEVDGCGEGQPLEAWGLL